MLWISGFAVAISLVAGGAGYLSYLSHAQAVDPETLCLLNHEAPVAALVMIDVTDRIEQRNVKMIEANVLGIAKKLPRASKLIVVPFDDDTTSALTPKYQNCVAAKGADARMDENAKFLDPIYKQFLATLGDGVRNAVNDAPTSHSSPITQQIIRAGSSPSLGWVGTQRKLILITDGLQTGAIGRRSVALPKPESQPLEGVDVVFIEVGNRRDKSRQSKRLRTAWERWLKAAGASSLKMIDPSHPATEL
ncbi:hypothetical protein DD559_00500 [Sphingomonas pokkalii]|uniref:VWFA domain-containing protein n=1 Tax=Sphingomonas pokkalii TaxID=2175090 RepID=A0A2U0S9P6_9SPHN|nr:hypothetical protein DD559_00500 [Sphingomonas pokkalii]